MTVAENLHRTAPELQVFALPREQDLYLRALIWKDLRNFNVRLGAERHFSGLEFRHFVEVSEALLGCRPAPGQRVLVAGAHLTPLPLYLASKGCDVTAVDIDPIIVKQEGLAREAGLAHLLSQHKFTARKMDARSLEAEDNSFDAVIALSTVDHTREEADTEMMRELARVAKPGACIAVSVGIGPRYTIGQSGKWPIRTYSELELERRLISPSGLTLLRKYYFGEDSLGLQRVWGVLPEGLRKWLFGWTIYPLAQAVAPNDGSTRRTATRIALLFQKPPDWVAPPLPEPPA